MVFKEVKIETINDVPLQQDMPLASDNTPLYNADTPPGTQDPAVRELNSNSTVVKYTAGDIIKTANFISGSTGWQIDGQGNAEFNQVTVRGTIIATAGRIANWYINTNTIASGSVEASSNVLIDSANSLIRLGPTSGNYITLDGANLRLRSSNYSAGISGFTVEPTLLEAENIVARGTMRGVSFKYDVISAVGGQMLVASSDALASDMTALDAATLTIRGDTTFAANDMLLIRAVASGIQEEYLRVTSAASAPTYTVTRDLASAFAANSNPAWKAGTTVVKVGVSDGASAYSGGWLRLLGEGTNSPFYSVFSRTGVAYNAYTERVRFGNLNGIGAFVTDTYGAFMGTYSTGKYLTFDDASGNFNVNGYVAFTKGTFGGDGSDGALFITSGTTTLSAASANILIKNYTSITISAGATLTISNKATDGTILYLKSQGDVTIAGTIEMSSMGANMEVNSFGVVDDSNHSATGGTAGSGGDAAGGAGGVRYTNRTFYTPPNASLLHRKLIILACGSGGATGGRGGSTGGLGGAGGPGGGCVVIECGGALNFTGTINVNGGTGIVGSNGSSKAGGAGGGGGTAGMVLVLYNTLTSSAGTVNAKGGAGGNGGTGSGGGGFSGGGGGGGGGAYASAGQTGGTGHAASLGDNGNNAVGAEGAGGGAGESSGGNGAGTGGTQGSSDTTHYLITQNKFLA